MSFAKLPLFARFFGQKIMIFRSDIRADVGVRHPGGSPPRTNFVAKASEFFSLSELSGNFAKLWSKFCQNKQMLSYPLKSTFRGLSGPSPVLNPGLRPGDGVVEPGGVDLEQNDRFVTQKFLEVCLKRELSPQINVWWAVRPVSGPQSGIETRRRGC